MEAPPNFSESSNLLSKIGVYVSTLINITRRFNLWGVVLHSEKSLFRLEYFPVHC